MSLRIRLRSVPESEAPAPAPEPGRPSIGRVWPLAIAAAVAHIVLGWLVLHPAPFWGGDNATYVALARSIVENGSYSAAWDPALTAETIYPPAFPAILAASIAVGADSWLALKLLLLVISAVGVALSVLWLARVSTSTMAIVGGLILAISPGVLRHTHLVLSDIPFFTFTMLALWGFTHLDPVEQRRGEIKWVTVVGVATLLAGLTRSAGLPLVLALGGALLVRRHWRHAAIFGAITILPMLAWSIRSRMLSPNGYASYLLLKDPYKPGLGRIGVLELVPRSVENAGRYLGDLFPRLLVSSEGWPRGAAMLLLLLAAAVWLVRIIRAPRAVDFWTMLYCGIILIWPVTWASERYVIVLLPVILLYAFEALRSLTRIDRKVALGAAIAASVALIASELPGLMSEIQFGARCRAEYRAGDRFSCTPDVWKPIMQTAEQLRGKLPDDAVVLSRKPTLFFVLSGYRSRVYPMSADPDTFFAAARDAKAEYVLLDDSPDLSMLYLQPVLTARPNNFCVIRSIGGQGARLVRIEPDATRSVPQPGAADDRVRFAMCSL